MGKERCHVWVHLIDSIHQATGGPGRMPPLGPMPPCPWESWVDFLAPSVGSWYFSLRRWTNLCLDTATFVPQQHPSLHQGSNGHIPWAQILLPLDHKRKLALHSAQKLTAAPTSKSGQSYHCPLLSTHLLYVWLWAFLVPFGSCL